jgi:hypothetical protein
LRLAGYPALKSNLRVKHTPSQTLNSDPEIKRQVQRDTAGWREYYFLKWGGSNEQEKYEVPFDGKAQG